MMYQMTMANTIANATNMPVCNGLLRIAVNAAVAKADAATVAAVIRVAIALGAAIKFCCCGEGEVEEVIGAAMND